MNEAVGKSPALPGLESEATLTACPKATTPGQARIKSVDRVEQNLGRKPEQVVADGGFTCRENIIDQAAKEVAFIGSFPEHDGQSAASPEERPECCLWLFLVRGPTRGSHSVANTFHQGVSFRRPAVGVPTTCITAQK